MAGNRHWPLPFVDDHNGAKWLTVRYCDRLTEPVHKKGLPARGFLMNPGWYVVRICPCHFNERITRAYDSEQRAQHARALLLAIDGGSHAAVQ